MKIPEILRVYLKFNNLAKDNVTASYFKRGCFGLQIHRGFSREKNFSMFRHKFEFIAFKNLYLSTYYVIWKYFCEKWIWECKSRSFVLYEMSLDSLLCAFLLPNCNSLDVTNYKFLEHWKFGTRKFLVTIYTLVIKIMNYLTKLLKQSFSLYLS